MLLGRRLVGYRIGEVVAQVLQRGGAYVVVFAAGSDVHISLLLRVHDCCDRDTEVRRRAPEVCTQQHMLAVVTP